MRSNGAIVVTSDPDTVARADRIVLPGVGAFADCRRGLDAVPGMVEALNDNVRKQGKPFFGICVGMQLMAERGHEKEVIDGLGWIAGEVDRIHPSDPALKIPHMGWNTLQPKRPHPLLDGLPLGESGLHAYFVHSYQLDDRRSGPIWSRRPNMAGRSPPSSGATIWWARNSTRKRAKNSGLR